MIVGVSVVRNEADIIETMVRQNLHYLDHLVIIDNGSVDGTPDIVTRLHREGLSCELRFDDRRNHQQHAILTDFVRNAAQDFDPKRLVFLDGDEFLDGDRDAVVDEFTNSPDVLNIPWKTYVPTPQDDPAAKTVLSRIKHRRKSEDPQYFKASIPHALCQSIQVGRGSHNVRENGRKRRGVPAQAATIAHFPVRNAQQLVGKILIGSWKIRMRKHSRGEARHWMDLANEFRQSPSLSDSRFFEIASTYANQSKSDLVLDPIDVKFDEMAVESPRNDGLLLTDIMEFTEELVAQYGYTRSIRQRAGDWIRTMFRGEP